MLLRFSVTNNSSIADEQELLLTASNLSGEEADLLLSSAIPKISVLPSILIYGPNASGKSNLLAALQTMADMVSNGHVGRGPNSALPYDPFRLDDDWKQRCTTLECDFVIENTRYCYSFSYIHDHINHEKLTVSTGGGTSILFSRSGQEFHFGRKLTGGLKAIREITRLNSLFVSAAAQNNHELLTKIYTFFDSISFERASAPTAAHANIRISREFKNSISQKVISFLSNIGTGVVGYHTKEIEISDDFKEKSSKLNEALKSIFPSEFSEGIIKSIGDSPNNRFELGHRGKDGSTVFLSLQDESEGTLRLLTSLPSIFSCLEVGGILVLDEVDASLHTLAADFIMALFAHKESNPRGAQLLATTHDTNLLDSDHLRRDQVWFAEKDREGKTKIYPLSDFKPRKNESMEKGYLQGRFGAIPRGSISNIVRQYEGSI